MKKYYAVNVAAPEEIAVFTSKAERNKWVQCEDWFFKEFNCELEKRKAITFNQAKALAGKYIHDMTKYIKDNIDNNIMWIRPNDYCDITLKTI